MRFENLSLFPGTKYLSYTTVLYIKFVISCLTHFLSCLPIPFPACRSSRLQPLNPSLKPALRINQCFTFLQNKTFAV